MRTTLLQQSMQSWQWLCLLLLLVVSGCGGGNSSNTSALGPFTAPPAPVIGASTIAPFSVDTANYFGNYVNPPFTPADQLDNQNYPVTLAYQTQVTAPQGFMLSQQSEQAIQLWAQADPRVMVVSGVSTAQARVTINLVNSIAYNNIDDIIGLTQLSGSVGNPQFQVYVSIVNPVTLAPMDNMTIARTLTHELGHVFGLGHSPDPQDVMYYQSNSQQGQMPSAFLTYGDALTIYTTLNNRHINWVPSRPTITEANVAAMVATATKAGAGTARVLDTAGTVVCVYTPQ